MPSRNVQGIRINLTTLGLKHPVTTQLCRPGRIGGRGHIRTRCIGQPLHQLNAGLRGRHVTAIDQDVRVVAQSRSDHIHFIAVGVREGARVQRARSQEKLPIGAMADDMDRVHPFPVSQNFGDLLNTVTIRIEHIDLAGMRVQVFRDALGDRVDKNDFRALGFNRLDHLSFSDALQRLVRHGSLETFVNRCFGPSLGNVHRLPCLGLIFIHRGCGFWPIRNRFGCLHRRLHSSSVYPRVFSLQLIQLSQHRILSRRAFGLGLRQRGWQGRIKNNALLQRQLTRMCSQRNAPRLATGRCLSSRGIGGFRRSHVGTQGFVPDRFV
ncbi:MAG: hypothetical protein A3I16_14110 [Burkholderiales bacterium RIFCSPLOWO2_02_FULL_66_35]|nr:MAG: hypothetical protein A3I16_14110 [Burkholderiales bacterium RIFCSPLOWO2_02_FULL_66_35]